MKKILAALLIVALMLTCAAVFTGCTNEVVDVDQSLTILYEASADLKNTYSILAVDPAAPFTNSDKQLVEVTGINTVGADAFINFMFLASTRELIANYGVESYGEKLFYIDDTSTATTNTVPQATTATKTIRLSTTTSVNDSGLMQYLTPIFEEAYGYTLEIASAGTGAAINAAKYGNADVILVHAKADEEAFIAANFARKVDGFDAKRLTFMYNYFVLVGPKNDPAKVKDATDIKAAFALIADGKYDFVSRGDASGTHSKEISLWNPSLGIVKDVTALPTTIGDWYISAGQGMGACLSMANEKHAYVLSDKATFLTFHKNLAE